jgi:hypothetical protein
VSPSSNSFSNSSHSPTTRLRFRNPARLTGLAAACCLTPRAMTKTSLGSSLSQARSHHNHFQLHNNRMPVRGKPALELRQDLGPVDLGPVDLPSVELPPVELPPVDLPPVELPPVEPTPVDVAPPAGPEPGDTVVTEVISVIVSVDGSGVPVDIQTLLPSPITEVVPDLPPVEVEVTLPAGLIPEASPLPQLPSEELPLPLPLPTPSQEIILTSAPSSSAPFPTLAVSFNSSNCESLGVELGEDARLIPLQLSLTSRSLPTARDLL